jgi:hypothetical protein
MFIIRSFIYTIFIEIFSTVTIIPIMRPVKEWSYKKVDKDLNTDKMSTNIIIDICRRIINSEC